MKPYGLKKRDRYKCFIKNCKCGDMSSKHPKDIPNKSSQNRRLSKHARQEAKKEIINLGR